MAMDLSGASGGHGRRPDDFNAPVTRWRGGDGEGWAKGLRAQGR